MDDQDLRAMAEHKGVDCVGTFFMILHLIHKKELSKKQALDKLDQMIKEGWYCSTEFYSVIRKELG
jgi:predicted nucleic acid-binding protein